MTDESRNDASETKLSGPAALGVLLARGTVLFLGAFGLLNVLAGRMHPGFDINIWWLDVRWLPGWLAQAALCAASLLMLAFGLWPRLSRRRLIITRAALVWLALVAGHNSLMFYRAKSQGAFSGGLPLPMSLLLLGLLVCLLLVIGRGGRVRRPWSVGSVVVILAVILIWVAVFPLGQMAFFGQTDYSRPVDSIVVFGAGVYADGTMSQALSDRVETACNLYGEGLAEWLIVSGGPAPGPVHETEAMRVAAIERGVPVERILVDADGLNTDATVANTASMFDERGIRRVLAVSHWYHLPRIKMTYQRAGWDVFTTPAVESPPPLQALPYFVAREVAAVWVYYLRPLTGCLQP